MDTDGLEGRSAADSQMFCKSVHPRGRCTEQRQSNGPWGCFARGAGCTALGLKPEDPSAGGNGGRGGFLGFGQFWDVPTPRLANSGN